MVAFAEKTYGGLHLAVNNAGIGGPSAPTGEYPLDGWQTVIDVNLNGVFYGLRCEIQAMLKSGGGAVVNMASILGSVGFASAVAYTSAKHALLGMTKVAAMEYATKGIRINAVGPGFIDTPLLSKNLDANTLKYVAGLHPIQRLGRAEEVSALTCFLLSDCASFITGSYHLVDGGYVAQ
jgi:NAD(P)-dependent dehydrogenase (short-subunit alcohol dehydrogenase family)